MRQPKCDGHDGADEAGTAAGTGAGMGARTAASCSSAAGSASSPSVARRPRRETAPRRAGFRQIRGWNRG
jgi:hypothetical protein